MSCRDRHDRGCLGLLDNALQIERALADGLAAAQEFDPGPGAMQADDPANDTGAVFLAHAVADLEARLGQVDGIGIDPDGFARLARTDDGDTDGRAVVAA